MATQTIAVAHVISFPAVKVPQTISQSELELLLSLRRRVAQLESQVESAETSILARLRTGATLEDGQHSASVKESSRRSVSWREVAERADRQALGQHKGELYCPRVLASTKPSKSYSLEIE